MVVDVGVGNRGFDPLTSKCFIIKHLHRSFPIDVRTCPTSSAGIHWCSSGFTGTYFSGLFPFRLSTNPTRYEQLRNQHTRAWRECKICRSGGVHFPVEELTAPVVTCLYFLALCEWHVGEIASCRATMAEAISLESLKGKTCCRQVKFYSGVYALASRWFCLSRILKAGPVPIRF
jgi:hypothetical protein